MGGEGGCRNRSFLLQSRSPAGASWGPAPTRPGALGSSRAPTPQLSGPGGPQMQKRGTFTVFPGWGCAPLVQALKVVPCTLLNRV